MKRRLIKIVITLAALMALFVAGWYTFCYWVTNWRTVEPPPCHESWSPQQCHDLLEIDTQLRDSYLVAGLTYFYEGKLSTTTQWLREKKWGMVPALLLGWRELCMSARAALHETMRTGKGDVLLSSGIPVADLALKFHKTELLKEFIRRGADPNHVYVPWTAPVASTSGGQSNLIWETFNGLHLDFETTFAPEVQLELLEFLYSHGGKVATAPNRILAELYALMPLAQTNNQDKGAATAWALRHGLTLTDEHKQFCVGLMQKRNPELLRELQREGLLPLAAEPTSQASPNE